MKRHNTYEGQNSHAARLIRKETQKLVGRYGFTPPDADDIAQELHLELHLKLPDGGRDPRVPKSHITVVIRRRVADLIEERSAAKRDWRKNAHSLNDRIKDGEEEMEWGETIAQEKYLDRMGALQIPEILRRDLRLDLEAAVKALPPELRQIAAILSTDSLAEASRATGIPLSTLKRKVRQLREIFRRRGLDEIF